MRTHPQSNGRTAIDVEEVRALCAALRQLHSLDIRDVDFYEGGVKLEIPADWIEEFRFTGLGLRDFIDTDFYKTGYTDEEELPQ